MTEANGRRPAYVAIARKAYQSHPFWLEKRVFSRWEAWEDLIQSTAYTPRRWAVPGAVVALVRGETPPLSRSFLAKRWCWSENKVWRYLDLLKNMGQIQTGKETPQGTTYLLVNYELYQGGQTDGETDDETDDRRAVDRRQTENKTSKQGKQEKQLSLTDAEDPFKRFWSTYPKRAGGNPKKAARQKWDARIRDGVDPAVLIAGAERYAAYCRATGREGSEYVKQAQFWLSPSYEGWAQPWDAPAEPLSELGHDDADFFAT